MEVRQIAAALDYADASAFTRAFRRWSGTTPARWRARRARLRQGRALGAALEPAPAGHNRAVATKRVDR